jgi:hypothetical protein
MGLTVCLNGNHEQGAAGTFTQVSFKRGVQVVTLFLVRTCKICLPCLFSKKYRWLEVVQTKNATMKSREFTKKNSSALALLQAVRACVLKLKKSCVRRQERRLVNEESVAIGALSIKSNPTTSYSPDKLVTAAFVNISAARLPSSSPPESTQQDGDLMGFVEDGVGGSQDVLRYA